MGILTINGENLQILPPNADAVIRKGKNPCDIVHVFAIGSKGIPAEYGGFETFMHNLTKCRQSDRIIYHISRMAEDDYRFEFNNAIVFDIPVPKLGNAKAIYYDILALRKSIRYCQKNEIDAVHGYHPVFFIMACRIGPVMKHYAKKIHKLCGRLYVNPDGHEWKRSKWSKPVRLYWKLSERLTVGAADLLICDSKAIEAYIRAKYKVQKTCYISYGAEICENTKNDIQNMDNYSTAAKYDSWIQEHGITPGYYLMVGRFVPENNFETILAEFIKSETTRDLVIITTPNDKFSNLLENKLKWQEDRRIKMIGTVYDIPLLKEIRRNAYGYIHGHEVGGTNPSLLESLGMTDLNLLYDCEFNREVAEESGMYWDKSNGCLRKLINSVEKMGSDVIKDYGSRAKQRIKGYYSWDKICKQYEGIFIYGKTIDWNNVQVKECGSRNV